MATVPTSAELLYEQTHINDSRVSGLLVSNVLCLGLAYIAVGLRFLCRRMGKIKYDWDDWLILLGLILTSGVFTAQMIGIRFGAGRHSILKSSATTSIQGFAQTLLAVEVVYNFATFCLKASILYLYHRVFFVSRRLNLTLCAVAIFIFTYSSIQGVGSFLQCVPLNSNWNPHIKRFCLKIDIAATVFAVCNVLTDFIILVLPMPVLWKMRSPTREKVQIMGMFLLGGFVCFASIYRCVIIHNLARIDPSWSDIPSQIWTMVELGMGAVSVCLPTMRPLFSRVNSKFSSGQTTHTDEEHSSASTRMQSTTTTMTMTRGMTATVTPSMKPSHPASFAHLRVLEGMSDDYDFAHAHGTHSS